MPEDLTRLLAALDRDDPRAASELLPLVYNELRRLASSRMNDEPAGQTLQATALVHEAYLRLVGSELPQHWSGRAHFFAAAAESMRRILVENARRKHALRRGGDRHRLNLDSLDPPARSPADEILELNEALLKLEQHDKLKSDLVKLRYFTGLTVEQAAELLHISPATAHRYWSYARAWLHREISANA